MQYVIEFPIKQRYDFRDDFPKEAMQCIDKFINSSQVHSIVIKGTDLNDGRERKTLTIQSDSNGVLQVRDEAN